MRMPAAATIAVCVALAALLAATSAPARPVVQLRAVAGLGKARGLAGLEPVALPAGCPTQTITLLNQAGARFRALVRVQRAIVAQSVQLRAAWGTPCVAFGPGGWRIYLKRGGLMPQGEHEWAGAPYALVWTAGNTLPAWSTVLSHEIVEMLVSPKDRGYWLNGTGGPVEVADPVEHQAYSLDGVYLSDFVYPSWYAGATHESPSCAGGGAPCRFPGPPDPGAGPWDQMHTLTGPWTQGAS